MSSTPHIKPLPPEAGAPPDIVTPSRRHGHGWGVFAALMIALAGVFNVIDGLSRCGLTSESRARPPEKGDETFVLLPRC